MRIKGQAREEEVWDTRHEPVKFMKKQQLTEEAGGWR